MTHIYTFRVEEENIYESILNLEKIISELTDGLDSMYRCKIKRTGKFEVDQIAAIVEISVAIKGHTITQGVYYILGAYD